MRKCAPLLPAALLSACAVGPQYHPPALEVAPQFANASLPGLSGDPVRPDFWVLFADPQLTQLERDALDANKDLLVAAANLRESRAARRLAGFDRYPTVSSQSGYTRSLLSQNAVPQIPNATRREREFDDAEVGFDAVWELDFFGQVRRSNEAARADVQAAEASLQDIQVSVSGEVARNYFLLRGFQEQLAVSVRNADNQRQTLDLTQNRLQAGRGSELDSSRAEAQLKATLATLDPLQAGIAASMYRLAVLTGRQPQALLPELSGAKPFPVLPALLAIGDPASLLRRRPDVRVAERTLAAATARIGVAVADLFPKVTFIGSVGYDAASFGGLGGAASQTGVVGPSISWAAFDLGRVRARIQAARAHADGALAAYQASTLRALEDTEDALVTFGHARSQRDTLDQAAAASTRAAGLARQRFEGGLTDFLNVLEAERDMLHAQDDLARSRTDTATSLIAVYKALGGGWDTAVQ
jgi:multidrug efflux system outer membrane protein